MIATSFQSYTANPSPRLHVREEDTFQPPPGDLLAPLLGSWAMCGHVDDCDGYCWGSFNSDTSGDQRVTSGDQRADIDVNLEQVGFDDQDTNLQPCADNQSDSTCLTCAAPDRATNLPDISFQQSSQVLNEASSGFTFSPFVGTFQPPEPHINWFSAGASFSFPILPDISSDKIQWPEPRADRFPEAENAETLVSPSDLGLTIRPIQH